MQFVVIDRDSWARWPEVQHYAEYHEISAAQAVIQLANAGLSHEPRSWITGQPQEP